MPREQLAFLFWPDTPDATARRNLTQRLSMLRHDLPAPELLQTTKTQVQLDPERCWSDVVEFSRLSARGDSKGNLDEMQEAVSLYRGPYLDGFSLPKNAEFERWLCDRRQVYERLFLNTLLALVEGHSVGGAYEPAIAAARRYLAVDELDENVHRRLIQFYAASGNPNAALRQYEHCVMVLERQLGVTPQAETDALYQAVLAGKRPRLQSEAVHLDWHTHSGLELPLLGREDAMQELLHAYRSARTGQGQFVLVSGEPGIGKTRLILKTLEKSKTAVRTPVYRGV
ncbi:MAG: AAA family ATPase, partial [Chloroflexi bacterium]|nr:AAA family ATPase [Chloroflexota bacterium]